MLMYPVFSRIKILSRDLRHASFQKMSMFTSIAWELILRGLRVRDFISRAREKEHFPVYFQLSEIEYKGQDTKSFIVNAWKFKDIAAFKSNEDVYEFLNSGSKSFRNLLDAIRKQDKLVSNKYEIKKKTFDIIIRQTDYEQDALSKRNSNIEEFFDVIDW